ncbi:hypothetical protein BGZ46_010050 [Entomortierella lignicola]|nr:hypothetical protein BGZ46_010050 [Entomortierella lignicola]
MSSPEEKAKINAEFEAAAALVKTFTKKPSDEELLKLYGLYKQATEGDNTTPAPGMFDLKGKYKWNAWTALKGKDKDEAKVEYTKYVQTLSETHK